MNRGTPFQVGNFSLSITHPLLFHVVCVMKKGSLCRLKINHELGSESCIFSWYTGLHGSKHLIYLKNIYFVTFSQAKSAYKPVVGICMMKNKGSLGLLGL
jgi:hypothetical protein